MSSNGTDDLQEGDTVTVELEGEVIDQMEAHDGLARIDVEGQKVEILSEEIIDIEQPDRPAGIEEVQQDGD